MEDEQWEEENKGTNASERLSEKFGVLLENSFEAIIRLVKPKKCYYSSDAINY